MDLHLKLALKSLAFDRRKSFTLPFYDIFPIVFVLFVFSFFFSFIFSLSVEYNKLLIHLFI